MDDFQIKILIVDDERFNLKVLSSILNPDHNTSAPIHSKYTLNVAKSGQEALKMIWEDKPDLILLDIIMPNMSGYEVLATLKESEATRNIPVIIITGLDSITDEEKGFSLGAVDYITKPFHNSLVLARVNTHLRIVEQMHTIEQLGLIDVLTNIPNRRGFNNQMTMEWGRGIREKTPISLLMIDVDKFKNFNDTYGHQQGDVVLQTIASVLKSTIKRTTDQVARWGGEEFAVLLPGTILDGALMVAESIRKNIESASIPSICGAPVSNVTVSIGVASTMPIMEDVITDFIAQADRALYHAKETGRNKVCH